MYICRYIQADWVQGLGSWVQGLGGCGWFAVLGFRPGGQDWIQEQADWIQGLGSRVYGVCAAGLLFWASGQGWIQERADWIQGPNFPEQPRLS